MNIYNISSYAMEFFSGDFYFQGARQQKVPDNTGSKEMMVAKLYEFQLSIRVKTVDNLVGQSALGTPGDFFFPDVPGLSFLEESAGGLGQADAEALIGEDGFFGISKTAARIAEFVLSGAGANLEKLRAGREGVLNGFKEAEQLWGGKLPDISYDTIENALGAIDQQIEELGGTIVSYRV